MAGNSGIFIPSSTCGRRFVQKIMKAVYLEKKAGADSLVTGEIPRPEPRPGEVLVKVHATAVMPTELHWIPTFNMSAGGPRPFPVVLSHEFSGVVEKIGVEVPGVGAGEAVYGLNDWFTNGAQAEYCAVSATALSPKPRSLDHVQSAVVPISALTAWQGLFERTKLEGGQRVLIHGAAGGVGTFAVQLAHECGAHVIATASAANADFVRSLGANEVIDHQALRFESVIQAVDVVFDGVGGETRERSWNILKPDGRLVTLVSSGQGAGSQRNREAFMLVRADGSQLKEIGDMIDGGKLRVFVAEVFPLSQAREAYARAERGGMRGKIALRVV
jgi:NADPH:quinone reductase-like Zn-dependent oxidoreductase